MRSFTTPDKNGFMFEDRMFYGEHAKAMKEVAPPGESRVWWVSTSDGRRVLILGSAALADDVENRIPMGDRAILRDPKTSLPYEVRYFSTKVTRIQMDKAAPVFLPAGWKIAAMSDWNETEKSLHVRIGVYPAKTGDKTSMPVDDLDTMGTDDLVTTAVTEGIKKIDANQPIGLIKSTIRAHRIAKANKAEKPKELAGV